MCWMLLEMEMAVGSPGHSPQEPVAGTCACPWMSARFDWQNDPSCSAEKRPPCLDSVIM